MANETVEVPQNLLARRDLLLYGKQMVNPVGFVSGQMELTSKCEQRCVSCQSWLDHNSGVQRGEWLFQHAKNFFFSLAYFFETKFEHLTLTGGDPQSWPHLHQLIEYYQAEGYPFKLRVNTALPEEVVRPDLWRSALSEVRLSLDAVDPEYYRAMRGVHTDPNDILVRAMELDHPCLSTLTCVSQRNIDHIPKIVERLEWLREKGRLNLRKAIFIPIRDMNDRALVQLQLRPEEYQEKWKRLQDEYEYLDWTSFGEQVPEGSLSQHKGVTCWVSRITFHVKHNGDLYTCCLMGGEALQTRKEFKVGNVLEESVAMIWDRAARNPPKNVYDDPDSPCSRICLFKQSSMNLIAEEASRTSLSMP